MCVHTYPWFYDAILLCVLLTNINICSFSKILFPSIVSYSSSFLRDHIIRSFIMDPILWSFSTRQVAYQRTNMCEYKWICISSKQCMYKYRKQELPMLDQIIITQISKVYVFLVTVKFIILKFIVRYNILNWICYLTKRSLVP